MRYLLLILIVGSTCSTHLFGRQVDFFISADSTETVAASEIIVSRDNTAVQSESDTPRFRKLKAALLALFLGHFGVHRIYLGTSPNVPVVYSLTLGGGLGLLPLADFIFIITSKDLDQYANSDKVFMWLE